MSPAKAGVQNTREYLWIPTPRLRGDKLRGNDTTKPAVYWDRL